MAIEVEELRALLGDGSEPGSLVEVPGEWVGPGWAFRPVFGDGVLRAEWSAKDADALSFSGMARTAFADQPVPVEVAFSHDGTPEVTGVRLGVDLPVPGVPAHLLARGLDWELPKLPAGVAVTQLTLAELDGTLVLTGRGERGQVVLVHRQGAGRMLIADAGAWQVWCTDRDLSHDQVAGLMTSAGIETPVDLGAARDGLRAGAWLVLPGHGLVPVRPDRVKPVLDPKRRDGLGRAMPVRSDASASATGGVERRGMRRAPHAVAVEDGFLVFASGTEASTSRVALGSRSRYASSRGWADVDLVDGEGVTVEFRNSPLLVTGTFSAMPAKDPYRAIVGGALVVDTGTFTGIGVGACFVPTSGTTTSFFGFAALGSDKGIGPPAFQVRGVAAGIGWRSNLRLPGTETLAEFPFLAALDDPLSIGADPDGNTDPLNVLEALTGGPKPWVTPAPSGQDPVWLAAGLAFTVCEAVHGRAMLVVQTGQDLMVALLGTAAMQFPRKSSRKFANVEIGLEAVIKPKAGELSLVAELTSNSYVLDPNCRLRGGVALKVWFGDHPNRGDFAVSVGGYHPNYRAPGTYPVVPRLGFDWDLSGTVTVSGSAYLALTPNAVMGGGSLEVRFHSGALKAWLTAQVDALIQWKPFYFDVGIKVSVGVSATIKVWFVRITIKLELGVSLRVWGPPTGGEAKVHLWFISFTIGFGHGRDLDGSASCSSPTPEWPPSPPSRASPSSWKTSRQRQVGTAPLVIELNHRKRRRVAWLMRQAGLQGRHLNRRRTTVPDPQAAARPDLVLRDFQPDAAALDARWCGDITYIPTDEGWLYPATVIDIASRRVVGWTTADHLLVLLAHAGLSLPPAPGPSRPGAGASGFDASGVGAQTPAGSNA